MEMIFNNVKLQLLLHQPNTIFLDWKNQYCENDYTIQRNIQIPIKLTMAFFAELEQNVCNLYGDTKDPE